MGLSNDHWWWLLWRYGPDNGYMIIISQQGILTNDNESHDQSAAGYLAITNGRGCGMPLDVSGNIDRSTNAIHSNSTLKLL